ncbi:MAG: hypothetical protein AAF126_08625 [Chloroflexota bacterium]
MTAEHDWLTDEQKVMVVTFADAWDWTDYVVTVDAAHETIASVSHDVNLIMHFKSEIPKGNPLPHLKRSGATQTKNTRHTAFVTTGTRFIKVMTEIIVNNKNWVGPKYVRTIEEALAHFEALAQEEQETPSSSSE